MNNLQKKEYKIIKQLAIESDITLLSKTYEGAHGYLDFKCSKDGYEWPALATSFKGSKNKKGSRCPECAGNLPLTLQDAIDAAAMNDGWCLSKKIVNARKPLEWKCKIPEHPPWDAPLDSVRNQKTWCNKCSSIKAASKKRLGIEYFQQKPNFQQINSL